MLELLSRDIKQIIHRYIFDYGYDGVKAEYKREWLSDTFIWDDDEQCFIDLNGWGIVNWRPIVNGHFISSDIYRFFGNDINVGILPKNY